MMVRLVDGLKVGLIVLLVGNIAKAENEIVPCPAIDQIKDLDSLTQSQFISLLTDPCRYDKMVKPHEQNPIPVHIQADINHLESSAQLQLKTYMTVQYRYQDERLRFRNSSRSQELIFAGQSLSSQIWIPHVIIRNGKDSTIMGIDEIDVLVQLTADGLILYTYRTTSTFYCWMNLMKFPFDEQECALIWTSWIYGDSDMELHWDGYNKSARLAENIHLTEFILDTTIFDEITTHGFFSYGPLATNFSALTLHLKLHREVGYYMMVYFIPSILLVCTSWVTFWLQADAGPPRAVLGASTIVAFITLHSGVAQGLPKVSYVKISDIWFLAISTFILGSLAEFAFVNVIWRRKKRVELMKPTGKHILKGAVAPSLAREHIRNRCQSDGAYNKSRFENYENQNGISIAIEDQQDSSVPYTMTPQEVAIWIDRKSRVVFPLLFLLFNTLYWTFVYAV